jgi:hypothetical protein
LHLWKSWKRDRDPTENTGAYGSFSDRSPG